MTDQQDEQRPRTHRQRERQYEINRITFQYAEEYRQGRRPRIEDYIQRYPQYASDLLEYAIYFHTIGFEVPPFEELAEVTLSPAAEKALARIRERRAAYAPNTAPSASAASVAPIEGLVKRGLDVHLNPIELSAAVGLTAPLLGKLEAHKIAFASIPRTLYQRLADALQTAPEAIAAYLGGTQAEQAGQAGAFDYADQPPTETQESFLDAVQGSGLSPEDKRAWAEIVNADAANP